MLSAVAMSKVTPPASAAFERLTVKVKLFVRLLPSVAVTSLIVSSGGALQSLIGDEEFRGVAAAAIKSLALSFVSMQPLNFLRAAFTLLGAGVGPFPSKQESAVAIVADRERV